MSPEDGEKNQSGIGVPRASGDEPGLTVALTDVDKCSPRERG